MLPLCVERGRRRIRRLQSEIKTLHQTLAIELHGAETESVPVESRLPVRSTRTGSPPRTDSLVGELAKGFEADWPYLAF